MISGIESLIEFAGHAEGEKFLRASDADLYHYGRCGHAGSPFKAVVKGFKILFYLVV